MDCYNCFPKNKLIVSGPRERRQYRMVPSINQQLRVLSDLTKRENLDQTGIETLVQIMLGEKRWDKTCSFALAESIWRIFSTAARTALSVDDFRAETNHLNNPLSTALSDIYDKHGKQIRSALSTIRVQSPEVLDVRWKEQLNPGTAASVAFELQTLPIDTLATGLVRFECDRNQLLELHHRLKEAQNFLDTLNSQTK